MKTTLINKLTTLMQPLRDIYVAQCREWAKKDFNKALEMAAWSYEKWKELYGVPTGYNERVLQPDGTRITKPAITLSKQGHRLRQAAAVTVSKGLDYSVVQAEKFANLHFENSTEKLASRILKKGLVEEGISITSSKIGVNIEAVITDGNKTVRAWTIIAEGEIQKPHYRYLVK